jgi:hypothetical protein
MIASLVGVIYYLANAGFMEEDLLWDDVHKVSIRTGIYHFSPLVFAGMLMLLAYVMPMILRPHDFLRNFMSYTVGLISYIFMMPTFVNIM